MTIKVAMDYIPSFEESIPMLLVEGNTIPLILNEIKSEVREMEERLASIG